MWTTSCVPLFPCKASPGTQIWGTSHLTHQGIRTPEHKRLNCSAVRTHIKSHYLLHFGFKSTLTSIQSEHHHGMETEWTDPTLWNAYTWCETFRVLAVLSSVTCSDRCIAGIGTRCHLTSSSLAGQRNLQAGMGDKLNKPAVKEVLDPSVSRTDYLSAPARLYGNTLFPLHKEWSRHAFQDWTIGILLLEKGGISRVSSVPITKDIVSKASRANLSLDTAVSQQVDNALVHFYKCVQCTQ